MRPEAAEGLLLPEGLQSCVIHQPLALFRSPNGSDFLEGRRRQAGMEEKVLSFLASFKLCKIISPG